MKLSDGVEWSVHCCTVLALVPTGTALPAAKLAEFHGVPAAYLAKHLQALAREGIVESTQGPRGGYRLARPAAEVTLLDVVAAVEGTEPAFRCTEIRQRGPAGLAPSNYKVPCGIARAMLRAENAWRESLRGTTIADLLVGLAREVEPKAAVKATAWMQEVLR
jgi:Rrf2 family protein